MPGVLEGRVAVVTGAGRGIGASVARRLAAEGARVVVNDLGSAVDGSDADAGPARQVVNEIVRAGGEATANTDDVTDFAAAERLIHQAVDTYGYLDVLVNVAGILRDRMIFNMSPDDWDAVIRVHLRGTFNTTRHASAFWREQRRPDGHFRIINFTSGSGLHGAAGQPNYAAAKMGIVGLTYSCAHALERYGVTTNAISPVAQTRMTATVPVQRRRSRDASVFSPDNMTPAIAYLASTRSDWCNGQILFAAGYQIGLFNVPQIVRSVVSTGPWDLPTAFDLIEASFRPAVQTNVSPSVAFSQDAGDRARAPVAAPPAGET